MIHLCAVMRGETSMRQIIRDLALSFEHRQRFLATNTPAAREATVTALYRHLLARTPDEGGLRSHADALAASNDPASVINSMIDSTEYIQAWGEDTVPGGRGGTVGRSNSLPRHSGGPIAFREQDRNANGSSNGQRDGSRARSTSTTGKTTAPWGRVRQGAAVITSGARRWISSPV